MITATFTTTHIRASTGATEHELDRFCHQFDCEPPFDVYRLTVFQSYLKLRRSYESEIRRLIRQVHPHDELLHRQIAKDLKELMLPVQALSIDDGYVPGYPMKPRRANLTVV